jgi:glycosyltransferase involved in cell wall biosynthesis
MSKVSIIIPARGEQPNNLNRTIQSIKDNATGEYEIIVGFNGDIYPDNVQGHFRYREEVTVIDFPRNVGIKTNINALAASATGKYIYKSDAHCSFGKGFDEILQADMKDDWIVMPRFYVLDRNTWLWQDDRFYDYFYLCCPFTDPRGFRFKAGGHWMERTQERLISHPDMDETPQIHGSGWMMTKDRFFELGGFPITDPYGHAQEPIHLALKNWFMGGKVMVNKKTWYAHMHQQGATRGYKTSRHEDNYTYNKVATEYMKDPRMMTFLEKFMPMPGWPDNWKELYASWKNGVPFGLEE